MNQRTIPYAQPWVDEQDLAAVAEVLRSGWLTTGPVVAEFEQAVTDYVGAGEAVAVSSGTAALHAAIFALGIGPGDEVIVPPLTFAATANAVVYQGGIPVFADIAPDTLLLDPEEVEKKISSRTRAIVAVDYAGQPCDYPALSAVAQHHHLALVADACHSLGAKYGEQPVGSLADLTIFSFHPAKHITTAEGGMVVTSKPELAAKMRLFRNHGISLDHHERTARGTWQYDMLELGYNYRLSDLQCALGISQLRKLPQWLLRRQAIAARYDEVLSRLPGICRPVLNRAVSHAHHLYVILLELEEYTVDRRVIFEALRQEGLGVNVHYLPVHLHPYYQLHFHTQPGDCPAAEWAYQRLLTLPLYPAMSDHDVERVIAGVIKVISQYHKPNSKIPVDLIRSSRPEITGEGLGYPAGI